jgi:hypothetical protein
VWRAAEADLSPSVELNGGSVVVLVLVVDAIPVFIVGAVVLVVVLVLVVLAIAVRVVVAIMTPLPLESGLFSRRPNRLSVSSLRPSSSRSSSPGGH